MNSSPSYHGPPTPQRLDLLVPSGWDMEAERESEIPGTDENAPPNDIMEAFLLDIEREAEAQTQPKPAPPSRFAPPMSDSEVQQAKTFAVPKRTKKDTAWCISLWEQWRKARNSRSKEQVPADICTLATSQLLQYWLSRFVLEVRKKDGQEYPPDTLYHIVCGIMRFLRQNGKPEIDFFKERLYADFRTTLDAEMKRLKQAGIGSEKRQPEPLTKDEEELLWKNGVLGDHSPQALLNSVFFFNGICFALRGGDEHRHLRFKDSQIQVVEKTGERARFVYTEDSSKNNQGGLKGRKIKTKQVIHHENSADPSRCPV